MRLRTNYPELQDEIFLPAAKIKPVYIIAGDVGARGNNLSPFYEENAGLYTLAIGLGTPLTTPSSKLIFRLPWLIFTSSPSGRTNLRPLKATPENTGLHLKITE